MGQLIKINRKGKRSENRINQFRAQLTVVNYILYRRSYWAFDGKQAKIIMVGMLRIGICRALHTYHYYPLWQTFLEKLGFAVVLSPPTNRDTVEIGIKLSPPELCLPVKVFLGQVATIKNQVDKIFLPRLVCQKLGKDWFFGCPKAIALPDLTRAIFSNFFEPVELIIDHRIKNEKASFLEVAHRLGVKRNTAKKAFQSALVAMSRAKEKVRQERTLEHMFSATSHLNSEWTIQNSFASNPIKIGVVGHPYLLFDHCLNLGLWKILGELKIKPVISFPDGSLIKEEAYKEDCPNWYFELEVLASVRELLEKEHVAGLLIISSFSCGTAPVVNEIIRRKITSNRNIPFINVLLDEHTAETALRTRLESFVDIVSCSETLPEK